MYFIGQCVYDVTNKRPCIYLGVKIMPDEEKSPVGYVVATADGDKLKVERGREGKEFTHFTRTKKGTTAIWAGEFAKHMGAGFFGYLRNDCENFPAKEMAILREDLAEAANCHPVER